MSTQSWKVDFDGPVRHIVADTDPLSGRTAIRVDGRIVAKPLAAEESERVFNVGSVTYVIRRNGQELDLDIAPVQMQAAPAPRPRSASTAAAPAERQVERKKSGVPVFKIIGSLVLTIVIVGAVRYGRSVVTYMNVPWNSYTHPDRMFRVSFAGVPERSTYTIPIRGGTLPALQLKSRHERHYYIAELVELGDVQVENVEQLTVQVFDSLVKYHRWKLLKKEWGPQGISYIAEVPPSEDWSEGTIRGVVAIRHARIYLVYAFVPRGESLAWDVGEFLRSLQLAE